jgi:hypothetical protein
LAGRLRAWLLLALFLSAGTSLPSADALLHHVHPDPLASKLDPNDIAPAGYTLANVGAGVALATGPRLVHVDVTLRNAFDKQYQSFLSRYKFASDPVVLHPAGASRSGSAPTSDVDEASDSRVRGLRVTAGPGR